MKGTIVEPIYKGRALRDLPVNTSGIRAMEISTAHDPASFQPAFLSVLEVWGQPLITGVLLRDCLSALSWSFFIEGELNEPTSDSIGSNSRREASSFNEINWV